MTNATKYLFFNILNKNNMERIIIKLSLREREEYRIKLGIRKKIKRIFSFWKSLFSHKNVRNKNSLFAKAKEVTVI